MIWRWSIWLVLLLAFCSCERSMEGFIDRWNDESVPYVYPAQIDSLRSSDVLVLIDVREWEEFKVSHISGADWGGYKQFDIPAFQRHHPIKDQLVVLYCTLGVRSERVGEKLQKLGYRRIYNLYGGIIEWKNQAMPLHDLAHQPTDSVHTYSRRYSDWLTKGIPTYD